MDEFTVYLLPEGGSNSLHTRNPDGEEFRRILALSPNHESPLSMRVKIVEVHHGTMAYERKNWPASLLVFEFRFQSRLERRRYKSANITLEFFDKEGNSNRDPAVVEVAPDKLRYLNRTTWTRATTKGANLGAKGGLEGNGIEAGVKWEAQETKPVKHSARLTGMPGCSYGKHGDENTVTWSMEENKGEEDGIPPSLQTAVLLKRSHDVAFTAKLRVKSCVDFKSAMRRSLPVKTDEDKVIDPVTFTPGKLQIEVFSVTGILPAELQNMERLPVGSYFKVNLSEDDPAPHVTGGSRTIIDGAGAADTDRSTGTDEGAESGRAGRVTPAVTAVTAVAAGWALLGLLVLLAWMKMYF